MGDPRIGVNPENRCPRCCKKLDAATTLSNHEKPKEGDLSVCFYCGQLMKFSSDGSLLPLEENDLKMLTDEVRKELLSVKAQVLTYWRNS